MDKSVVTPEADVVRQRWVPPIVYGLAAALALLGSAAPAAAQQAPVDVTFRVTTEGLPVPDAQITVDAVRRITDARGEAVLPLPPGQHTATISAAGLETASLRLTIRPGGDTIVTVSLEPEIHHEEAIIVNSTRTDRRIEDEPIRVEAIGREEIEEKLLMTPGDIAMLLNETAGLRVQPTAPSLGGASVRIQGLRGRYTQVLSDGLPLHGGQTGALGALQIPPMDLRQVEVIKGAASALYGASALGGVVNLLSRRPGEAPETEALINQTTLGGTDAILWRSAPFSDAWGYTLLASGHRQSFADVDDDGWADLAKFRRGVVRPRVFWQNGSGSSLNGTLGAMVEERSGGTMPGHTGPNGATVRDGLRTARVDAGVVANRFVAETGRLLRGRVSGSWQTHDHSFAGVREQDRHGTIFTEVTLSGTSGAHTWLVGIAAQMEHYRALDLEGHDYTFTVPGLLVQDELAPTDWLTVAGSARLDTHSEYGTFLSPRFSVLLRPGGDWTVRTSVGTGFFAPTPWVDETEAVGLSRLVPFEGLEAERARSASLDVGRTIGDVELNATLFASEIRDAVQVRTAVGDPTRLRLLNAAGPVRTRGTELLARYHVEGLHLTATYVHLRATEPYLGAGRREVPLTPRNTAGVVAAWEQEGRGRIGVELYYTGSQTLEDNPYRDTSEPYFVTGVLIERRFGSARLFLNAENLLDTRQTRHDPLVLPARSADGRWTTDVWAPLEGRSFNGGVRWEF